jgi:hypothetical protein
MKVKLKQVLGPGDKVGDIIEASEGKAEYMQRTGQGEIVEGDSPVAHDMGSIPDVPANTEKPKEISKGAAAKVSK